MSIVENLADLAGFFGGKIGEYKFSATEFN